MTTDRPTIKVDFTRSKRAIAKGAEELAQKFATGAATDLPLDQATQDVIARYRRGNDMLASAAIALRKLRERIESGEPDGDGKVWDWHAYRAEHLERHISSKWLNTQLRLAPPGATEEQVKANVETQ